MYIFRQPVVGKNARLVSLFPCWYIYNFFKSAHVVVDRGTKWFGPPHKALKRIKYMSTSRSDYLYNLQSHIMKELKVPVLDVYQASLLSGDWHFPTDGRHYRPEFNQWTHNWFYRTPETNITVDYTFRGYGVESWITTTL